MNHFERVAIFTLVENIESQLKGLKTLIAASSSNAGAPETHKVTPTLAVDSDELTDDEEDKLAKEIHEAQTTAVNKMVKNGEAVFQNEWALAAEGMAKLNG